MPDAGLLIPGSSISRELMLTAYNGNFENGYGDGDVFNPGSPPTWISNWGNSWFACPTQPGDGWGLESPVRSGAWSAFFTSMDAGGFSGWGTGRAVWNITGLTVGWTYTISAWVQFDSGTSTAGTSPITIEAYTSPDVLGSASVNAANAKGVWKELTFEFVATDSSVQLTLDCTYQTPGNWSLWYVDDVSLWESYTSPSIWLPGLTASAQARGYQAEGEALE